MSGAAVLTPFVGASGDVQYAGDVVMRRHRDAPPGFWGVMLLPTDPITHFFGTAGCSPERLAVVDDFGTLIPVDPHGPALQVQALLQDLQAAEQVLAHDRLALVQCHALPPDYSQIPNTEPAALAAEQQYLRAISTVRQAVELFGRMSR